LYRHFLFYVSMPMYLNSTHMLIITSILLVMNILQLLAKNLVSYINYFLSIFIDVTNVYFYHSLP
jgi:hypothetical protein